MNIKEIRKTADLTTEEMAKAIGVSKQALSAWEAGVKRIPNNRLAQIQEIAKNPEKYRMYKVYFTYEEYQELIKIMPHKESR